MSQELALDNLINDQPEEKGLLKTLEYYRALSHQLIRSHEEERRRLGQELRDDLTQQLAALALEAGRLEKDARELDLPLVGRISELKNCSVRLAEHAHLFSRQLYPAILEDLGLVEAIRSECLAFRQEYGIVVKFLPQAVPLHLPTEPAVCIYRLVQEALTNVAKHACATKVTISLLARGGCLCLSIRNNGKGCDPKDFKKRHAMGYGTIRERVSLLDGTLEITTQSRSGVQIWAYIPLRTAP
jgi:signal transduction histidine kinase